MSFAKKWYRKSCFSSKLAVVMILFTCIVSFTFAMTGYLKLKEQVMLNNQLQVQQMEEILNNSEEKMVWEIVYNEKEIQSTLDDIKKIFLLYLFIFLVLSIIITFFISSWVAKPMYLAFHDSLTGLKNRAAFDEILVAVLAEKKGTIALLMIDLDDFKLVNDHLGHDRGDYLLKYVAESINSVARKEDVTFRWGGDEFVIIMSSTSKQETEQAANMIIAKIQELYDVQKINIKGEKITVSIGIALAPVEHGIAPEILCKWADNALYASKEKGKNQYQIYIDSHNEDPNV